MNAFLVHFMLYKVNYILLIINIIKSFLFQRLKKLLFLITVSCLWDQYWYPTNILFHTEFTHIGNIALKPNLNLLKRISVLWMWNVTCKLLYLKVKGPMDESSINPKNLIQVWIILIDGLKNVYIPLEHILLIWRQNYYLRKT